MSKDFEKVTLVEYWLSLARQKHAKNLQKSLSDNRLELSVNGKQLVFGNSTLDLSRKPLMANLFRKFLASPTLDLDRHQVIEAIYGPQKIHPMSNRLRGSRSHSAVRLVSRARAFLRKNSQNRPLTQRINWLAYCTKKQRWRLMELNKFDGYYYSRYSRGVYRDQKIGSNRL